MDPIGIFLLGGSFLSFLVFLFLEFRSRQAVEKIVEVPVNQKPAIPLPKPIPVPQPVQVTPPPPPTKPVIAVPRPPPEPIPQETKRTAPFPPLFAKLLKS